MATTIKMNFVLTIMGAINYTHSKISPPNPKKDDNILLDKDYVIVEGQSFSLIETVCYSRSDTGKMMRAAYTNFTWLNNQEDSMCCLG